MANVLPPRHGGVMAAIGNAPDADIVFVAHTLFEDVGSIGQLWQRIPLKEPVLARFWRIPVAEVPEGTEELRVRWVPLAKALEMTYAGQITDSMSVLGLQRVALLRLEYRERGEYA